MLLTENRLGLCLYRPSVTAMLHRLGSGWEMKKESEENQDPKRTHPRDITLEEVMRPYVSVTPDTVERDALEVMLENNVPCLPVVDEEDRVVGCVTDKDILASVLPPYLRLMKSLSFVSENTDNWVHYLAEAAMRPVREVMTKGALSLIELEHSDIEAAHKMVNENASTLVVTKDGKAVGVVNRLDLCAAIVGLESD